MLAALLLVGSRGSAAATRFDPALRFRILNTPHFRIYFDQRSGGLALRLAAIAEDTWTALQQPFGRRPPPLTHVVLADQTELPNAYATPLPYDTIVIYPTWPTGAEFNVDDWLRVVFTHEFTHIVHLDRSEGWARVVRGVFGRLFVAFPNVFLPTWQVEGLATYEESTVTGQGRLHAGEFRAIVDEAARGRRFQPLDRVNGGLTDWPGGQAPYAYGARFHQYLATRFGSERLAELAGVTAGRVPYTASRAFSKVFGASLGSLWRDFESASLNDAAATVSLPDEGIRRLTHTGFVVSGPRFDRVCPNCPPSVIYAVRTPDEFPALKRAALSSGDGTTISTRYFGATTAVGERDVYFDQLEIARAVGLYGDLYRLDRNSGQVRRLTQGARLHDPDLSPDGSTLAAVQENGGRRDLVLVPLSSPGAVDTLAGEDDVQFNAPRWSPDGTRIAVERHRRGSRPEIVIVDVAARTLTALSFAEGDTRAVMPSWRPDGRGLVAAIASGDRPFNLVEVDLDRKTTRLLTHTTGGATWPEVSPDGRTIVFVGYTTAGYDLFAMPFPADASGWDERPPTMSIETAVLAPPARAPQATVRGQTYSPLPTLKPTSWAPIVESDGDQVRIGAATDGSDVLGYHGYSVAASWLAASTSEAPSPDRAVPDWFVSYAYDRWRPTIFAAASAETSFFAGPATASGTPSAATRRERQVEAGVLVPFLRARSSHDALATIFRSTDDYTFVDRQLRRDRAGLRGAWRTTTARAYGYSVSPEDGISSGVTAEIVRTGLGASANATTVTGDFRAFLPGLRRHHIVAVRLAGGASGGDSTVGRTFLLGGAGPDASEIDFGSGAISVLRGFPSNSFAGSRVALANLEYRFPLARPQRGVGTWPLFLHTIHAAAFADIGHAWTRRFVAGDRKTSFGAELSANLVAGYYFPLTLTVGAARGHDGSLTDRNRTTVYVRVGRSF